MFFRELLAEEVKEFRQWARDNYKVGTHINEVWHPFVQDECEKMNNEANPSPNGNQMLVVGYKLTNIHTGESLQVLDLPSREIAKEIASTWRAKGAEVLHLGTHVEIHTKN